jgi:N-acetylglucosaminyldiphosphoundecaprenol N-acetyl-beta-D-mannosaminyltransferase
MFEHKGKLNVPVLVGVGAAFDFHTGRVAQAPEWMRENGLEWFFRLTQDPRRLWRRYILGGARFTALVALETLRLKKLREPAQARSEPTDELLRLERSQVAEGAGDKVE